MIGEALRLIRVFHDCKSKDLALELGISPSYLSEIENSRKRPSIDLIAEYARVFKTKPSVILYFAEETGECDSDSHVATRKKLMLFLQAVERFTKIDDS
jgi:transcriptional regulator with XRE-family HTH domain